MGDARLVLEVIVSPSRAFERMGRGDYLGQAVWVMALVSVAGALPLLPFAGAPLESRYGVSAGELGLPSDALDFAEYAAYGVAGGLVSAALMHAVGRKLGGLGDWRGVFAAVLHAHVPAAVASAATAVPAFMLVGALAAVEPGSLEGASDQELVEALAPFAGYALLLLAIAAAAFVWVAAVLVKSVMVAHSLGPWTALFTVAVSKTAAAAVLLLPALLTG